MAKRHLTPQQAHSFAQGIVRLHTFCFAALALLCLTLAISGWRDQRNFVRQTASEHGHPLLSESVLAARANGIAFAGFVFLVLWGVLLRQSPAAVQPRLLAVLGIVDAPCAIFALVTMRYGAGKHAPYLLSRVGWAVVMGFVLLTSATWMAWDRLQRAKPAPHDADSPTGQGVKKEK